MPCATIIITHLKNLTFSNSSCCLWQVISQHS